METTEMLVVGAGAAGLFAATWAGRTAQVAPAGDARPRILVVDGARKLNAKILVAGGGRCNVTHYAVSEADYAGSSPAAIRKVLRRFPVADTTRFFEEAGVALEREDTGKLFPVTDSARTVLEALIAEAGKAGAEIRHPARVAAVEPVAEGFIATTDAGPIQAERVILCTGGKSLPKSGSDGGGFLPRPQPGPFAHGAARAARARLWPLDHRPLGTHAAHGRHPGGGHGQAARLVHM